MHPLQGNQMQVQMPHLHLHLQMHLHRGGVLEELFRTKCLRTAKINAIFINFCYFEIKPGMRDVLAKCGNAGNTPKCGISRTIAGWLTQGLR